MTFSRGFALLESVLAAALLLLTVVAVSGAFLLGQQGAVMADRRSSAVLLAEEGVLAVHDIAFSSFESVPTGTFDVTIDSGLWTTTTTIEPIQNIYTRTITIELIDKNTKKMTVDVTWPQTSSRNGSVQAETLVTNWEKYIPPQGESLTFDTFKAKITGEGKSELTGITASNLGTESVIITTIRVDWVPVNQNIKAITIGSTLVWSDQGPGTPVPGTQPTGTTLNIPDYTLTPADDTIPLKFEFSGNVKGNNFTILFTLADGSTKTMTLTNVQ